MVMQVECPGGAPVTAVLDRPDGAAWLLVLAHGAGAGMRHRFMEAFVAALGHRGVATLRYEYPYMSAGRRRPDPAPVLEQVSRCVVEWAAGAFPELRLAAGGRSMGGRMTSRAHAAAPLRGVERLVFLGFPLHPAGRPALDRAQHLALIDMPMLFVQGGRDALAEPSLIRDVCAGLGAAVTLHVIPEADHGFAVLKRSGRTGDEVLEEIAGTVAGWLGSGTIRHG
jgi:uncharacterized protein